MSSRRLSLLAAFVCNSFCLCAQEGLQQKNDSMFTVVKRHLDRKQTDSLYKLMSADFMQSVSATAFSSATNQIYALGRIQESEYLTYAKGISSYKLVMEKAALRVALGLDSSGLIQTFFFQPYREAAPPKTEKAPTNNRMATALDSSVDAVVRPYIQKGHTVGLSIAVLKDGARHFYAYGSTTKDGAIIPDQHTLYEIGSVTKTFTALLLAYYAEAGKLRLEDPITKYLPDSVAANKHLQNITLLMLTNHSSGLPRMPKNFLAVSRDPANPYLSYNAEHLFAYLKGCTLETAPGATYAYSNLGMALLGVILERVGGRPWNELIRDEITLPLKMVSTVQDMTPELARRFPPVYDEDGAESLAWEFTSMAAAGALRSDAEDMLHYAGAFLTPEANTLGRAMQQTLKPTTEDHTVGMGWFISSGENTTMYYHGGATAGSRSFIGFVPGKNIAVVMLSNVAEDPRTQAVELIRRLAEMH